MIYIDGKSPFDRISLDCDHKLVQVKHPTIIDEDNWGDEDCMKWVKSVSDCDIIIDKSIADKFKNYPIISFIRFNYYHPAYSIQGTHYEKSFDKDGNLIYHITN